MLGGGAGEVALAAWAPVFLAELAGSGCLGVEVRVACGSSGGLTGPCALGCFWLGAVWSRPFVPGPTRVCPGRRVLAGVGVCAVVGWVVWFCSAPVRVLCVSPRSRPPPPCAFEQYKYQVPARYCR